MAQKPMVCGCCGGVLPTDPKKLKDVFCSGCGHYICDGDRCAAAPMGNHGPWAHRPCDVCGESVSEKGASYCEDCGLNAA